MYTCNKVFVVLGSACNMACQYCIQHQLSHKQHAPKINPDVVRWIDRMADERDTPLQVCFYGGEPLLYYPAIRQMIGFSKSDNIQYGLITNGRALTCDMLNFFNARKVSVTLSWDGARTKETRGYDVLSIPSQIALFLRLEYFGLSGVISSLNYPLDMLRAAEPLDAAYFAIHQRHIPVNLDYIFGVNIPHPELEAMDWDKLGAQMERILSLYDEQMRRGEETCLTGWVNRHIFQYLSMKEKGMRDSPYCPNGYGVLNVDTEGNLYLCHNVREVLGTIDTPLPDYLNRVMARHENERQRQDTCKGCSAFSLCNFYCPLIPEMEGEAHWCRLRRAVLTPIVRYIERRV